MGNTATPPADMQDGLTFEVMVTLEDQLALHMRCLATPAMQAGRLRREAVTVLIAALCAPFVFAGGVVAAWAGDRHAPSLGSLFHALVLDEPRNLVIAVLVMVVCLVGSMVLRRWLLRPRLRRVLRRILRARPDVNPSDPQLAFRARVIVGDEGLESRSATGVTLVRWDVLNRWEEVDGHLVVLGEAMVGCCLGTPIADPEALDQCRVILTAHLGPKNQTTGRERRAARR